MHGFENLPALQGCDTIKRVSAIKEKARKNAFETPTRDLLNLNRT